MPGLQDLNLPVQLEVEYDDSIEFLWEKVIEPVWETNHASLDDEERYQEYESYIAKFSFNSLTECAKFCLEIKQNYANLGFDEGLYKMFLSDSIRMRNRQLHTEFGLSEDNPLCGHLWEDLKNKISYHA